VYAHDASPGPVGELRVGARLEREVETSVARTAPEEDCDVVITGLVADIRDRLPSCGFDENSVVEVLIRDRGIAYRVASGGGK